VRARGWGLKDENYFPALRRSAQSNNTGHHAHNAYGTDDIHPCPEFTMSNNSPPAGFVPPAAIPLGGLLGRHLGWLVEVDETLPRLSLEDLAE
jgi:hypothetical protein